MNSLTISGPFPSRKAFQALRDRLISHLLETRAAPGDAFCSEAQLMEKSGLSRTTVRKAVDELCRAGWLERRAGVGTFVGPRVAMPHPPSSAQPGRGAASGAVIRVAVLVHLQGEGGADYFTRGVLQGLDSAAVEEGVSVELVGDCNMDIDALVKRLKRSSADVLVVMPSTARHALLAGAAEAMGIPCLVAGTHLFESGLPTVQENGEQGAALAVKHLIAKGHRRIGIWLCQAPAVWVHQRRNGFMKALEENGIAPDERWVLWTPYAPVTDVTSQSQLAHVDRFLAFLKEQRPTAMIIGSSGQHTRALSEALRKGKIRVPQDLSLVFLDQHYEDYSRYLHRRPTAVLLPLVEVGRTLARLAVAAHGARKLGGPPPPPLTVLPCGLAEGDSVAEKP